jgi:hypothetical protein
MTALEFRGGGGFRNALIAALGGAAATFMMSAIFGQLGAAFDFAASAAQGALLGGLLLLAVGAADVRGVQFLWVLSGMHWALLLASTMLRAWDYPGGPSLQSIPGLFVAWTFLAMGLAAGSMMFRLSALTRRAAGTSVLIIWLSLAIGGALLSSIPLDVGSPPFQSTAMILGIGLVFATAPVAIMLYFVRLLRSAPRVREG